MVKYRLAQEEDYELINDFHNRIYNSSRTLEQFYWEFNNCPFGKSIYVIAEDRGEIIGTNCVIPIDLVTSDKKIIRSGKSEDTLVDPKYRGQKIFYKIYDFLFEKCRENGIQIIWGFTSAKKPFKRLGFSIPFDHQQSLVVNNIWNSYKYLSSLNNKNKILDKVKIFGFCSLSKIKVIGRLQSKLVRYRITIDEKIIEGVDKIIDSNLSTLESSFSILQNSEFQEWRIYRNPNYYKIHTYGFYDNSDKLKALIVLNSHPNKVAYINQSSFYNNLDNEEKTKILQFVTRKMFDSGIHLIRNWHFNTNTINSQEIDVYNDARYTILNRGIGFVWKELERINYKPEAFYLSRISTQGVI
jgi:GNAT superfamily N-acetyltransferase